MSMTDNVRAQMMSAMKSGDRPRKDALSGLLSALKNKQIDKRAELTAEEEGAVVLREIKQAQETMESAPSDRTDIIDECKSKISVWSEFAPKMMDEAEIRKTISGVLEGLGIASPTAKDKGLIMKNLMPLIKGKADGGLVNKLVSEIIG